MAVLKPGVELPSPRELTLKQQFDLLEANGAVKRFDSHPALASIIDSRGLPTRKAIEVGPDDPSTTSQLRKSAAKDDTLVVGGAVVKNLSILIAKDKESVTEVPIRALPAATKPTPNAGGLLMAPANADHMALLFPPPSPTSYFQFTSQIAADPVQASSFADEAADADTSIAADAINSYSLSGDLENFWGIKGLTGKLYVYNGDSVREKVKFSDFAFDSEKNTPLLKLEHSPLAKLFPHIDLAPIKQLPIKDVEFTYTEDENDFLYEKGLRLEGNVECTGHLQPVADMLKHIYGDKDAPSELHVSAYLSDERDWNKPPKITKLVLGVSLMDGQLKVWDFMTFESVTVQIFALQKDKQEGDSKDDKDKDESKDSATETKDEQKAIEPEAKAEKAVGKATEKGSKAGDGKAPAKTKALASKEVAKESTVKDKGKEDTKESDGGGKEDNTAVATTDENTDEKAPAKPKKTWEFGLCILGTASLTNLPKANKPLRVKYRIERDPQESTKALYNMHLTADDWKNAYGVKNLNLTEPKFTASFEASSFASTAQLYTSATVSFAGIVVATQGKLSKDESYLDGQVGAFTYHQLLQAYAQIRGDQTPELSPLDAAGNDLKFENFHLRLSSDSIEKVLELSGKVIFNEHVSSNALIKVGSAGLVMHGDINGFKIEGTEITVKKAALDIEIGAKPPPKMIEDKAKEEKEKEKEPKAIDDASKEEAADSEAKTTDAIDPSAENDKIEKKEDVINKNLRNRKSKFSVTGDIDYSGRDFKIGVFYKRQAQTKKREWLVYGVVDRFNLSELFHGLKDTDFDFTLENVALMAASKNYVDNNEINALGYTIKDGVSLWAKIKPPQPIIELHGKENPPLASLKLSVSYSHSMYTVTLEMPETMNVYSPKDKPRYGLEQFNVGLEVITEPKLTLGATLKIFLKNQDPLELEGMLKGGPLDASGSLRTKTPWINPFNVNKNLILEEVGVELGIDYATVCEQGPSEFGFIGQLQIEETKAGVDMKISETDGEMLSVSIDKLNLTQIIRYAGHLAGINGLQNIGNGENLFIIDKGSLYISSGVRIGSKSYPKGFTASATVTIFDKTGQFDAEFDDSGFIGNGSIDRFKLGALEVSAASDVTKPATFDISMTQDEQKIKIDGMIHYHDIELLALVDADLQNLPPMFNAHLLLKFTEQDKIDFFANASLGSVKSLSEVNLEFSALMQGDLFDLICHGVNSFLDNVQKLADQEFDNAKQKLEKERHDKNDELKSLKKEMDEFDKQIQEHEVERKRELEQAQKEVKENNAKLQALKDKVDQAKDDKAEAEKIYRAELEKQQRERNEKVESERQKYEEKLRGLRQKERDLRRQKAELDGKHDTDYGMKEAALKAFEIGKNKTWDNLKMAKSSMDYWDGRWNNASWTEKYFGAELNAAVAKAKGDLVVAVSAWEGVKAAEWGYSEFTTWTAYKTLMSDINSVVDELTTATNDVEALVNQGVAGFILQVQHDEDQKVGEKKQQLDLLLNDNSKEQKAIQQAEAELNAKNPEILEVIQRNNEKIATLEDDDKRKELQAKYNAKEKEYGKLENTIHTVESLLEGLQHEFDRGIIAIKDEATAWRDFYPRITRVEAKANSNAIKNHEPIFVAVTAVYKDITKTFGVQWTPNSQSKPFDLYKAIGSSAKDSFPPPVESN